MRVLLAIPTSILAAAATTPGQAPLPEPRQVRVERSYQGSYTESVSRELFTACDGDSDDRLDVFEAAGAFPALPTPRDVDGFARLDTDRDGFVTWPEFDVAFRRGIENGGTFRVQTSRPFVMPAPPPQPATPLQQFLRLYDVDEDGSLSPAEIDRLLERGGLPAELGTLLRATDVDGSGKVSEAELAPWFQALPIGALPIAPAGASPLPQPWFDADADENGAIDAGELERVLRRIDPGLARWTGALLAALDADRDGAVTARDLAPPAGAARPKPGGPTPPQR